MRTDDRGRQPPHGSLFQARRCKFPPNNHTVDSSQIQPLVTSQPQTRHSSWTWTRKTQRTTRSGTILPSSTLGTRRWKSTRCVHRPPPPTNHEHSMTDDDAKPPEIPQHPRQRRRSRGSFGSRGRRHHQVSAGISPSGAMQLTHAFLRTASDAKPETSDPIASETTAPQDANKVTKIKRSDACLSALSSKLLDVPSHLFFPLSHHDPGRHIPSRSQKLGMKHGLLSRRACRPSREFVLGLAGLELLKHLGEGTLLFYIRKCANQALIQAHPNAAPPPMAPQVLLGSGTICDRIAEEREMLTSSAVQDEGLKKLLMSWYYAGEYPLPPCS